MRRHESAKASSARRADQGGSVAPVISPDWRPSRTVGVVLAGGSGVRAGLEVPKQLVRIAGKSVLEHTIGILDAAVEVDEVLVLMAPGYVDEAADIVRRAGFSKVSAVVAGGPTRSDTTRLALARLGSGEVNVLFHDAVRPLLNPRIIRDCVAALQRYGAVDVAIPSADTIIALDDDDCITAIPPRARLRRGQTPQAFRSPVIREAYRLAAQDRDFAATDDCGVVLRYLPDVAIKVVAGAEENIKITHAVDFHIADKLFQLSSQSVAAAPAEARTNGLAGRTLVVFGGSSGIGGEVVRQARAHGAAAFPFSRTASSTDVERPEDIEAALKLAYAETGRVDYVVVTAGQLHLGPLAEVSPELVERSLRVNYLAPVRIAQLALPYLRETAGQLLLYTSSSYTRGRGGYALYSSAKAAVVNLAQALADEWAADGVRVNCLNPERTATPMRAEAFGAEPPATLLTAEAVAQASLDVLLSELTGQVVDVRRR
jgi:2-C-methyl-D-erythritol 4-phosphate cytidylyltransferase